MCDECGCGESVVMNKSVTEANDIIAHQIWHMLQDNGILCVNIMGAPGSGKTTFIEGIAGYLDSKKLCVIQGDLESDIDKRRLEKRGIATYQINTHSGCHLNAEMINNALLRLNLKDKKYLLIENVGNLVCPAGVKLGQHMDVVVSSVAEGSDKPKKYPHIFLDSKMIIISKSDLAGAVEFDEQSYTNDLKNINGKAKIVKTSSKDEATFKKAAHVLEHERAHLTKHVH